MCGRFLLMIGLIVHGVSSVALAPQTITVNPEPTRAGLAGREVVTTKIATCGWTSGDAHRPKTCPVGQDCGWYTGALIMDHGVVCVPFLEDGELNWDAVPLVTKCVDWGNESTSATDPYSQTTDSTLLCGYSDQKCATAFFPAGPSSVPGATTSLAALSFTSLFCTDSPTIVRILERHTNTLPPSMTFSSSTSSVTSSTTSTGTSSSSSAAPTSSITSSSSNFGAIAGGTVGGIVGIAAVAGLIFYLVWRKRNDRTESVPELGNEGVPEVSHSPSGYSRPRQQHGWQQIPSNGWLQVPQSDSHFQYNDWRQPLPNAQPRNPRNGWYGSQEDRQQRAPLQASQAFPRDTAYQH